MPVMVAHRAAAILSEQRQLVRGERSRIIADDLCQYLEAQNPGQRQSPSSAKRSLYNHHWDRHSRFLDDGRIDLDNNAVERSFHPLALNRMAVIAMLIESCKLSGIDPHIWLTEALTKLVNGYSANSVGDLMPRIDMAENMAYAIDNSAAFASLQARASASSRVDPGRARA